jgi:hypothetical protein
VNRRPRGRRFTSGLLARAGSLGSAGPRVGRGDVSGFAGHKPAGTCTQLLTSPVRKCGGCQQGESTAERSEVHKADCLREQVVWALQTFGSGGVTYPASLVTSQQVRVRNC